MNSAPLISVCIPAYGRAGLLEQLLQSLEAQSFRDFNVFVSDNSSDDAVEQLCRTFSGRLDIHYHRNPIFLEMGANWNACMELADGQWLKMMHDDDWFTDESGLGAFAAEAARRRHGMIYSGYYNVRMGSGERAIFYRGYWDKFFLHGSPFNLLRGNFIGPPSATMIHRDTFRPFQPQMKWLVDMEWYLRILQLQHGLYLIENTLISVGVHPGQATTRYFQNPEVEIPENCMMLAPHHPRFTRNFFAYDYAWRMIRNTGIRSVGELERFAAGNTVPDVFRRITKFQRMLPASLLKNGLGSKLFMAIHWMFSGFPRSFAPAD